MSARHLEQLFSPRSIALFGASERPESVGGRVYANLLREGFAGGLYPINPKHRVLHGQPCHASLQEITAPIDLAVIATRAETVADLIQACGEQGIRAAIILSAGFNASSERGSALLAAVLEQARHYGMRILGPNCLGLIRPARKLNATFSHNRARPGNLALISQSGALCTAILDWAAPYEIGFSAMVSLGDAAEVDFADLLDYLALDPETGSILMYIEGIRNARRFLSALRSAARLKPVVVIKVGRHQASAQAALSHTGALVGADDVFDAALRRAGAVRVGTVEQLFSAAQLLAGPKRMQGKRIAIITNGGGPGVMATDRAVDCGIPLADIAGATLARLNQVLPPFWSGANPVDILGDSTPERYASAVSICLADDQVDGLLVILTPQAMTDPLAAAQAVIDACEQSPKPVLACWMGNDQVAAGRQLFAKHQIPHFPTPEGAIEAFSYLMDYYQNQQLLLQVPGPLGHQSEPDSEGARLIIEGAWGEGRSLLNSAECKAVLKAFGIPVLPGATVRSANEALVAAEALGFPVVMKIDSDDISHKSEADGVRLNIANAQALRGAYTELLAAVRGKRPDARVRGVAIEPMYRQPHGRELMVGVVRDAIFGPVIAFGAGGVLVEIMRDRVVALPPLNAFLIDDLIARTRVAKLLGPFRNLPPINLAALQQVLWRLSEMVCELPRIRELDINPLVVDEQGALVLDARILIDGGGPLPGPYAHTAIHPYPRQLVSQWQTRDGVNLTIRPIRPEDAEIERRFVHDLSAEAKYFRFMQTLQDLTPRMLVRFTQIDYDRDMALIAVLESGGQEVEIGVARYAGHPDGASCEFALVVADAWRNKGVGAHLLGSLMQVARARGFRVMTAEVLAANHGMLKLVRGFGFSVAASDQDAAIRAVSKTL